MRGWVMKHSETQDLKANKPSIETNMCPGSEGHVKFRRLKSQRSWGKDPRSLAKRSCRRVRGEGYLGYPRPKPEAPKYGLGLRVSIP